MPTLADVLRQTGYSQDGTLATPTPTESPMTKALADHIASIPQKFNENQAHQMSLLNQAFPGNTYKSMMTQGDPKAMAELAMQVPFTALTAFHGTPHNIVGKFDINKVGTGEGAQAYGHGMYFAENPNVAKNYMEFEGLPSLESKVPLSNRARNFLDEYVTPESKPSEWLKYAKEDAKANGHTDVLVELSKLKAKDIGHTPIGGNLYKVDIPDEYIPNMLLWDEPLSKQPKAVKKALEKLDPDLYSPKGIDYDPNDLGQLIYERLTNTADKPLRDVWVKKRDELIKKGVENNPELLAHLEQSPNPQAETSKLLNSLGIKGIKYKDEGSRKTNLSTNTHNFVVFDPSEVKILEKNSKPVSRKELIEEQVNKLKD